MKAFEKIFHRRIERTIKLSISMNSPGGLSAKEIAKLVWKEALEWVLKHEPDIGLTACIKKELKG